MVKEKKKTSIIHRIFLLIAFITFIAYLVIEIINFDSFLNFLPKLLGIILILLFLICFIILGNKNKKQHSIVIVGSILIIIYSIINSLLTLNIISFPSDEYVPNFYSESILKVNEWKEKNNINVTEVYEYSDTVQKNCIISQSILAPTLTKNVTEITITISLGPDLEKEVIVPSLIGLKYDEVLKYIENNHLSKVNIDYQVSEKESDIVISQSKSGTMKRNEEITIIFSKNNEELGDIKIIDFTNKSLLYATSWLKKYGFKVEIKEEYSDDINEGYIISQSVKDEVKNPETETIILTVSKGKEIFAPDISSMSVNDINKWAVESNVKISYKEEYSDTIKLGDVISSSINKGDLVNKDKVIVITISKGTIEMINLTTVNNFVNWAENNGIAYQINYENSDTVKKDDIIKCSHQTGQVIKKDDTIVVTVSRGKQITIPNFVGMSKTNIESKCSSIKLNCSFKYGGLTEGTKKDIAISQNKNANTTVSEGTNLVITLSSGIQEKVNVPSFIGKTKSQITSSCNSIGIKCTFKEVYDSKTAGTCIKQSVTGRVNKGSTVTITISKGACRIVVQGEWLSTDPNVTKSTLKKKLESACPGISFKYSFVKVNVGIGYLNPNSDIKVGEKYLVQGQTYNVIINSN